MLSHLQDSNYFNLAIAPILRSMPQQKLRVLAELQVHMSCCAAHFCISTLQAAMLYSNNATRQLLDRKP